MQFGTMVKAFVGDDEPKVGFFLHAGGEGDDGKDAIQVGETTHPLAYRGAADAERDGQQGTYRGAHE